MSNYNYKVVILFIIFQAILLKQSLVLMNSLVIDQQTEVINELCEKILKAQKQAKKGIKAQKVRNFLL